jgi:AcrR family transcriptional regulator
MCARTYSMGRRAAAIADTRRRILDAARRLLATGGATDLGLDAIAHHADVSRPTIYNHFGSRSGLLEALYDYLATRGNVRRGREALRHRDPESALAELIRALGQFWSSDRVAIRRLHAMAALDPEIARGLAGRENRRRRAAREIVRRLAPATTPPQRARTHRQAADMLSAVMAFETYDALARAGYDREEIVAMMTHLARAVLASC